MHLFVGDSSYEVETPSILDTRDLYLRQKADPNAEAFIQYHGTFTKKLNLIPTDAKKSVRLKYVLAVTVFFDFL